MKELRKVSILLQLGAPYFVYPYFVMFPLFCTIFRFWNYKIRGTYYAFRIQIPKFWDSRYIICTLNLQNTKNENTNFQFLFPTNPLNPKRPHEDVFDFSLLNWRFSPQQIFLMKTPKWPLNISLSTGANQKIIEKGWSVRRKKMFFAFNAETTWECFSRRKKIFFEKLFSEIFFLIFFQNIFHFFMKTRTKQKILWSIFELFWSVFILKSWMHSMFPLFCTK